jgi:hypothetical protein
MRGRVGLASLVKPQFAAYYSGPLNHRSQLGQGHPVWSGIEATVGIHPEFFGRSVFERDANSLGHILSSLHVKGFLIHQTGIGFAVCSFRYANSSTIPSPRGAPILPVTW